MILLQYIVIYCLFFEPIFEMRGDHYWSQMWELSKYQEWINIVFFLYTFELHFPQEIRSHIAILKIDISDELFLDGENPYCRGKRQNSGQGPTNARARWNGIGTTAQGLRVAQTLHCINWKSTQLSCTPRRVIKY